MYVEIGNEAEQFHFWESVNRILFVVQKCENRQLLSPSSLQSSR